MDKSEIKRCKACFLIHSPTTKEGKKERKRKKKERRERKRKRKKERNIKKERKKGKERERERNASITGESKVERKAASGNHLIISRRNSRKCNNSSFFLSLPIRDLVFPS